MVQALIIGGGIAGSATAIALHKAGVPATVYEASPAGGEDAGAFLVLSPTGMRALDQLDATESVVRNAFPLRVMEFRDSGDRVLNERSLLDPRNQTVYHHIRRADLYRALQDEAVRRGIPVEHGKRLSDVRVQDNSVRAEFTDGTSAEGGLLIGADGVRSTVRAYTDPEARPQYVGERIFYGYSRADPSTMSPDSERFRFILGRKGIFGQLADPDGQNWWFARIPDPELSRDELADTELAGWHEYLRGVFHKDKPPASEIIAATEIELIAGNVRDLPGVTWRRGPALLVGDAAHAVSPASGQGASVALEDAIVLGKSLRDRPNHTEALTTYEHLRRDRVEQLITGARNTSRSTPPTLIQRWRRARRLKRSQPQRSRRPTPTDRVLDWNAPIQTSGIEPGPSGHQG